MFTEKSRFCVIAFVVVLCSVVAFGEPVFVAHFNETHTKRPNSTMQGTLYYRYNVENPKQSLLAMRYEVPSFKNGTVQSETLVRNVYNFEESAMYSMCSQCTGINFTEFPDPWYNAANYYEIESDEQDGYFWFTRTSYKPDSAGALNEQVSRILMKESSDPSAVLYVKEIEFRSGRKLVLSEQAYSDTTEYDQMFVINAGCPTATCPIYADLIFILDNSGSVTSAHHAYGGEYIGTDWEDGIDFVKKVIGQFTFGDDAAKGALIQFNAPARAGSCGAYKPAGCGKEKCAEDHEYYFSETWGCVKRGKHNRCEEYGWVYSDRDTNLDRVPNARTASHLGGLTGLVASNTTLLNAADNARNNRPEFGNTCQGYGLLLAMETINASRRSGYDKKPQPIVIVVTDGEDLCPVTTRERAEAIKKEPYNAHLIEIGVGLDDSCDNYDRKYLENISSHFDGEPSYYPVSNYSEIHKLVEKIFINLCEGFADNDCGSGCEGFCGCGKCFCPTCDGTGSLCSSFECDSDEENSDGCVYTETECSGSTICEVRSCNDTDGQCYSSVNTSSPIYAELTAKYTGLCHEVYCLTSQEATDGWDVRLNNTFCKEYLGGDQCVMYMCSDNPDDPEQEPIYDAQGRNTGCYVFKNKIKEKEKELESQGLYKPETGKGCLVAKCNPATGNTYAEVYCGEGGMSKECAVCARYEGEYQCIPNEAAKPPETYCTGYQCSVTGWKPYEKENEATCTEYFDRIDPPDPEHPRCYKVRCVESEHGCNRTEKPCACSGEADDKCMNDLSKEHESSTGECWSSSCALIDGEFGCSPAHMDNCYETMGETVEGMNQNDRKHCLEPVCVDGECTYRNKDYPDDRRDNSCYEWICIKENGEWRWDYQPTAVNLSCVSDACTDRVCDPDHGCNETDICMVHSNDCFQFTCGRDKNDETKKVCVNNSLLIQTKCMHEVCRNGMKYFEQRIDKCSPNKCQNVMCVFTDEYRNVSECRYSQKDAPDNDLCKIWECDINTGEWHDSPACYDGLYCTTDKCWKGQCRYPDVACDLELNMDGYPCFQPKCKEAEGRYKCVRKLIPNAYIDICGHCIMSDDETSSDSGSQSGSSVDQLTVCTGAPPKPVLTQELAAAAIALIILAAVIVGAGITASGVIGTKQLIDRAKGANNQSAHSNPLFEDNETELSNPAYIDGGM